MYDIDRTDRPKREPRVLKRQFIEPKEYRDAMARYAGHVQVVTTRSGGDRRGVTATAACSVSDSPGIVLVCLNKSNPRNRIFLDSGVFALNALGADMQAVAAGFSGQDGMSEEERFARAEWDTIASGAPTLVGALAVFDCRLIEHKAFATHMVLFGEVVGLRLGEERPALIYFNRDYRSL